MLNFNCAVPYIQNTNLLTEEKERLETLHYDILKSIYDKENFKSYKRKDGTKIPVSKPNNYFKAESKIDSVKKNYPLGVIEKREIKLPKRRGNDLTFYINVLPLADFNKVKKTPIPSSLTKKEIEENREYLKEEPFVRNTNSLTVSDLNKPFFDNVNETKSSSEILTTISNSNHKLAPLAKKLLDYVKENDVLITLVNTITDPVIKNPIGQYNPNTNTILVSNHLDNNKPVTNLIHEILHAISYKALRSNNEATLEFRNLYNHAKQFFQEYNSETNLGTYALYTEDEFFVALFTDAKFIKELSLIPPTKKGVFQNLFDEIKNLFLNLLNLKSEETLFTEAFSVATSVINQKDEPTPIEELIKQQPPIVDIKPGVEELFNENPELASIGSLQQYSQYLDQIFPNSVVKDIVYHGTDKEFDKFKKPSEVGSRNRTIAFADDIEYAKIAGNRRTPLKKVISALVNINKLYPVDKLEAMELDSGIRDEVLNELKKDGVDGFAFESDDDLAIKNFNEILVFEPEQIHILGSKKDIEGFKNFINKPIVDNKGQGKLFQLPSTEGQIASEKTIRDLAARMSDRIGIPVRFESDRSKEYKGKIENNVAYINLAYATLDTVFHEVAGHSIIRALKLKSEKNIDVYLEDMITKGIITKEC
jgi:hypothetical protein